MRTKQCLMGLNVPLFCVVLVVGLFFSVHAQDASDSNSVNDGVTIKDEPIEEALKPMYKMTNGFLAMVQPNEIRQLDEDIDRWIEEREKSKLDLLLRMRILKTSDA